MKRLEGRIALISGGSKGIGRAITLRLASEGANVVVVARGPEAPPALQKEVHDLGVQMIWLSVDMADAGAMDILHEAVGLFHERTGLDILVNNFGGVEQFTYALDATDEEWQQVFNENIMSAVRMSRAVLPLLKKSSHASIINIASVAGVQAGWYNGHYGSMKAALIHLTKYLANNYGRDGIRANVVCPSTIKGGVWERDVQNKARMENLSFGEAEAKLEAEVKAKSVLNSIGTPEDVAAAVAFLASDDARMITGSCLNVDGGTVKCI